MSQEKRWAGYGATWGTEQHKGNRTENTKTGPFNVLGQGDENQVMSLEDTKG